MKPPLWTKADTHIDHLAMRFMAGDDAVLDRQLFLHDIEGTRAHALGLADISALSGTDIESISSALDQLGDAFSAGTFTLDERYEDGHSAIESYLTEHLGELGKRVHLGRSRNDQVLVALRLYMKATLTGAAVSSLDAARAALELASKHEHDPMPGYTHLQRAVPSSAGFWMASFTESFTQDAALLLSTRDWIDDCPLGTAAGYGVNLDLPRREATKRLGFDRPLINPMHAQATRGKAEVQTLGALWQAAQTIRRLAWDLSLFSSHEFSFVTLPPGAVTGSSIMPNKRNPDLAELLRAVAPTVGGCIAELHQLLSLPSGYHRDLQSTKPPLLRGCAITLEALDLLPSLLRGMTLHTDHMRSAIDPTMYATDEAVRLAATGASFRDAYRTVGESLGDLAARDPEESLRDRISLGASGCLALEVLEKRMAAVHSRLHSDSQ